jgi:sensor histidine kinase YesM
MINDGIFRAICIPLLGVFIPWAAHLLCCPQPATGYMLITLLYFALASLVIWQTIAKMVAKVRMQTWLQRNFARKILMISALMVPIGFLMGMVAAELWQQLALQDRSTSVSITCGILYAVLTLQLVLLYEALFLSKERELDVKIVDQLDHERVQAEITALKAELDPHFIFNALTTVSHLTSIAPETARSFTQKLAQVYKYFLINKDRELISLSDELRFIEDYFYLLQIRYDHSVHLRLQVDHVLETAMVLPCSLQLLVENAIKHNRFSESQPLHVVISVNETFVTVENEVRRPAYPVESTRIGLLHLRQHYRLACNREITVEASEEVFKVHLPLIKQQSI